MLSRCIEVAILVPLAAVCAALCLSDCRQPADPALRDTLEWPYDEGLSESDLWNPLQPVPDPRFTPPGADPAGAKESAPHRSDTSLPETTDPPPETTTPDDETRAPQTSPVPEPVTEPSEPAAAADPQPLRQLPVGWPDGLQLQKWSTPTCGPCITWDRNERHKLEAVLLPDRDASTDPEARSQGITVVPYFQLIRDGKVLWNGRGYWTADAIIGKAQSVGRPL
jgi:hypothetical protein